VGQATRLSGMLCHMHLEFFYVPLSENVVEDSMKTGITLFYFSFVHSTAKGFASNAFYSTGKGANFRGVKLPLLQYRGSRPGHFKALRTGDARPPRLLGSAWRARLPPPLFPVLTRRNQFVGARADFAALENCSLA